MNIKERIIEWLRYSRSPYIIAAEERRIALTKQIEAEKMENWIQKEIGRPLDPTICKKCDWYRTTTSIAGRNGFKFKCTSPKAPYSDYETGYKDPKKINDGKCLFYKPYKGQMPPFWREM